jgi:hypothetical protein
MILADGHHDSRTVSRLCRCQGTVVKPGGRGESTEWPGPPRLSGQCSLAGWLLALALAGGWPGPSRDILVQLQVEVRPGPVTFGPSRTVTVTVTVRAGRAVPGRQARDPPTRTVSEPERASDSLGPGP